MQNMTRMLYVAYLLAFGAVANGGQVRDCRDPLGMKSGDIRDSQIHAASIYGNDTTYGPSWARLGQYGGYRADPNAKQAWMMVFFSKPTIITGIATQGYGRNVAIQEWVVKFWLGYSDGKNTLYFKESRGSKLAKQFDANTDHDTIVRNAIPVPESVVSISIMPIKWHTNFALRFELYGCLADGYECLSTPCQNNGTCVDLVASYRCNCTVGFNGTNCQHNIDDCASDPCQHGGNCTDLVNGYTCGCLHGYSGKTCDIDIDECLSSPCFHGGSCVDLVNGYQCTCIKGYGGPNCKEDTGFFLVAWLRIKGKAFSMEFLDKHSTAYQSNTKQVRDEMTSILQGDDGFLSAEIRTFSPGSDLGVEVLIDCLKNSTNRLIDIITKKIANGTTIFRDDYINFEDTANPDCQPSNISLPLAETMATATQISRYIDFLVSMQAAITCEKPYTATYQVNIFSIHNSTGRLQTAYSINGNLQSNSYWKIPARALHYGNYYVRVTSGIARKRGTSSSAVGFIEVGKTPLVSKIDGQALAYQGIREVVYLNGSLSYDPDLGKGNYSGMEFIWLCRRDNETITGNITALPYVRPSVSQGVDLGGCYGTGVGRLEWSRGVKYVAGLDIDYMRGNIKYVVVLVVRKEDRSTWSEHSLYIKEEIDISLICKQNCRQSVIPSKRLIIERRCEGLLCSQINSYDWNLRHYNYDTRQWIPVPRFADVILTYMNSPNLVTKEHTLIGNTSYVLRLTAKAPGDIVDTTTYRFVTNAPPSGGKCIVDVKEGEAWLTFFYFTCSGWQDEDLPLTYKYRYNTSDGIEMVFFSGNTNSANVRLPVGDREKDFVLPIQVQVLDSLDSAAVVWLNVMVTEPAMSSVHLEEMVGKDGEMNMYLQRNNIELAAQRATSVISVVNSASPKEMKLQQKIKIKDSIVTSWSAVNVSNLDELGQVSAVVTGVSDIKREVSFESQRSLFNLLESMTSVFESEVHNKTKNDRNEFTIQVVGSGLLHGMGNIMEVAAINAPHSSRNRRVLRSVEDKHKESQRMVQETVNLIDKVGHSLVQTKELYEKPSVFKTKSLSMMIDRQKPSLIGGKTLQDAGVSVSLPPTNVLLKGDEGSTESELSTQMVSMATNPFTWDTSSDHIKSVVLDFQLKTTNGSHLAVTNLDQDFELFIPVATQHPPVNSESYFAQPSVNGSMQYHLINIPGDEYAVSIKLTPLSPVNVTLYVRYGSRPSYSDYNYTTTVPDYGSCNYSYNKGYFNCSSDPFTVTISSALTGHVGLHYIGVMYKRSSTGAENMTAVRMRVKRDCFSSGGRHKRSLCVGVKDPPPTPFTIEDDIPRYDPESDVNYTMVVTIATCLYWNTNQQKWTPHGCRVGPRASAGILHCLCNHLSSFGGNFFVAPNPIDFNKVRQRFTNFDPKNFVVFMVVFGMFALYLLALLLARRADRKDEAKATETLTVPSTAEHLYEISIYTGMWRNNGTTANVAALIYGQHGESDVLQLSDRYGKRKLFARASINNFMVSLPDSLGSITEIKLWHDNEGSNPSWYINQIVIHDVQDDLKSYFICNRWLAVDKEDGEVQAGFSLSSKEELSSFKYQFSSRISRSLGDGHLWLSVATRPPHSPFTRVQRVSCCLSVLYCAMVASAMFYQFGEKSTTDAIKFGPLRFSIKQLVIGLQSALVVVPINLFIVAIFRNVKLSHKSRHDPYSRTEPGKNPKSPGCLPHFFVYIGWFLCMASVFTAGTFTILYSLSWGGEVSNQWLTSVLIAYVQDIGVIQPIKVVTFAVVLAVIIKKPIEEKTSHSSRKADLEINQSVTIEPPKGEKLQEARAYRKNIVETARAVGEIIFYLVFVVCLFVFVYGNRGYERYRLTKSIQDIFTSSFKEVQTTKEFWSWTRETLVPGLYNIQWYRPGGPRIPEGYISSKEAFLVGMPRFRQLRMKMVSPCEVEEAFPWSGRYFSSCIPPYSPENEERIHYNLPHWIPVKNTSLYGSLFNVRRMCPKPWRYQSSKELGTFSIQGTRTEYDGGGYVADLGYNSITALGVISDLQSNRWIDKKTAAVIVEFTVFEPSSALFSHAKFIYEMPPFTGKPTLYSKVDTLSLYSSPNSSFRSFFSIVQIFLLVFIFCYLISEIGKILHYRCKYFRSFWNWMNLVQLLSSIASVVLFFFKENYVSNFIKQIQANPYETTSMDYVLFWCNLEVYVIALVIFVVTIKFLRLLRFNRHICQMTAAMSNSSGRITTYTFVFLIDMMSFGLLGVLVFGPTVKEYSTLVESLSSLFQKFLGGEMLFYELVSTNRIIGPLFVFLYMLSMTFILINMFVAILNDSYESVRHISGGRFPDSDLGSFIKDHYQQRFRGMHDVFKRKLGKFGYKTKLYNPQKQEAKTRTKENLFCSYTSLTSQEYPSHGNLGFSSESLLLSDELLSYTQNDVSVPEILVRVPEEEVESLKSDDIAIETATTASIATTTTTTPELLDLISDLPESLVDDEDTIDNVREKLSNVGAILRLSKRSYRRFSTSGDKFLVQREVKLTPRVQLHFTPEMKHKYNVTLM